MGRTTVAVSLVLATVGCRPSTTAATSPDIGAPTPSPASGPALPASDLPVMGIVGLRVPDVDAARTVLVSGLLGTEMQSRVEGTAMVRFVDVVVIVAPGEPSGGSKGSVVDHIGFRVPDLAAALPRLEAAGAEIVTAQELPPVDDATVEIWFNPDQATNQAFVMIPGGVKVEVTEVAGSTLPVLFHHVHFMVQRNEQLRSWYADLFGAVPGHRGSYATADLPGVNLTFSSSEDTRAPTQGRALEHIGLDVPDLNAMCDALARKKVELLANCGAPTAQGFAAATFVDPGGTLVVVTETLYDGTTRPHWGAR